MLFKIKKINIIQNLILIISFVFIIICILCLINVNESYDDIDKDTLLNLKIIAAPELIKSIQDNPYGEEYIKVDVEINGKIIKNCGFRTKGSTSYKFVQESKNPTRFGYRLEFDYFQKDQSYNGIKKLYINNGIFDKTYIKEMIAYDIYEKAQVKTPKRCLTEFSINEKNEGIYTVVEIPEEDFLKRNYGNNYGIIYKPKIKEEDTEQSLMYKGDNIEDYTVIYDCEKFGRSFTKTDAQNLIMSLKAISDNDMEEYVDIPSTIDYLVASFFIPNEDSYISLSFRNFYIYQKDKKITLLPYDLNIYYRNDISVNRPILYYDQFKFEQNKPLIYNLLTDEKYQKEYKEKMYNLIDILKKDNYLQKRIDLYDSLIRESIEENENNFYSYDDYIKAIPAFKEVFDLRMSSVKQQLDSGIHNQYVEYEKSIDVTLISD